MEFRTNNRPRPTAAPAAKPLTEQPSGISHRSWPWRRHGRWIVLAIIVLLIAATITIIFILRSQPSVAEQAIKHDKYQAVFLTNNQVYFGRLSNVNDQYVTMHNVYYLQVQQALQPQKDDETTQQPQQASLSKLGSEIHGPEDSMYISRDQVLFWENLKDDSQVVKAIQQQK